MSETLKSCPAGELVEHLRLKTGYELEKVATRAADHIEASEARIAELTEALERIVETISNPGRGDAIVNARIIERIEDIAFDLLHPPRSTLTPTGDS